MKNNIFVRNKGKLSIVFILFITATVYANSLRNSFVWDDVSVIVDNNFVKSWKNLPLILSTAYFSPSSKTGPYYLLNYKVGSGETSYRPIVTISYFIDYFFWRLNPFGYHLTSLLLHLLNVLLLFIFIKLTVNNKKIALLSCLLFALHPVNSEAVNVISFREDLLVFLFFITSLILYIKLGKSRGKKKTLIYILVITSFFLALFSKEMALSLPFILIIYDFYFLHWQKNSIPFMRRYAGHFLIMLFYLVVRFCILVNPTKLPLKYAGGNLYTNLLTMSSVFTRYIQWLFFPINLYATLPSDPALIFYSIFNPRVIFSLTLIITCILIAIKVRRTSKEISFAIVWFFITLLPVSNIIPIITYEANRYLYIPAAGFCFLISMLLFKLSGLKLASAFVNIPRQAARDTIVILIIFYSLFTIIRNNVWKDNIALLLEMAQTYPKNSRIHADLGSRFREIGLLDKAITEYRTAINLVPNFAFYHKNLGECYYEQKNIAETVKEFQKALALDANLLETQINLGTIFGEKGFYQEAIDCFEKAIRIEPDNPLAYNHLGVTYARMKNWGEAKKAWKKTLEINPEYKTAEENLDKLKQLGYY